MTCAEIMTQHVAFCSPDDRVDLAAIMMRDRNVGALPVVGRNHRPVGIVTDRDLAIHICADGEDSFYKRVREIMHSPVVCCHDSDDVLMSLKTMTEHRIRRIPIIGKDGTLVGIITADDLTRALDPEAVRTLLAALSVAGILEPTHENATFMQRTIPNA
jgi:CBS domain-containing protein